MKKQVIILFICVLGYVIYDHFFANYIPSLDVEKEKVEVESYHVYGRYLNLEGKLDIDNDKYDDVSLVLYNGEFKEIDINLSEEEKIKFNLSDYLNKGLYLDNIDKGKYYIFLRTTTLNKEKEKSYKYYSLINNTDYKDITYYTLSFVNNKIDINYDNEYKTLMLNVDKNKDKGIYDIVLDPGHGGMDVGALSDNKQYAETDFTLDIAKKVKKKLEKSGLKVKLTWDDDTLKDDELLEEYGKNGRATISYEVKAKYVFSIHINSNIENSVHGLEVYAPMGIDYKLAKSFVDNITEYTGLELSNRKVYKVDDGVYSHNFTDDEIASNKDNQIEKGYKPYDITTNSNYFYMIRETGGIVTGAYVDDRNEEIIGNPYYDSNIGSESYILELGYITSNSNLNNLLNKEDKYVDAIVDSIKDNLKIK